MVAKTSLNAQHPWPGLRSFAEVDSAYFFGREAESQALYDLVERAPVVVLYGQSGLGKTSLLRAGLFPLLKADTYFPVWVRLDWTADAPTLTQQVLMALGAAFKQAGVEAPPVGPEDSLWSYFHRADADFWGPRNRLVTPVIVLDQFEEIFTLGCRDAKATQRAEAFVSDMEAQFEQRPPATVRERLERYPEEGAKYDLARTNARFVLSLREDYLPHMDAWRDRLPSMLARRCRLEPMTCEQALQVVQRAGGALVSDAVAEDIVAFVATGGNGQRVEPAILSVVCDELNLRRERAGLPQITRELLSGERSRIIADFYERSFEGISEGTRDWVEDELLTASGHRDRAAMEDARKAGVDNDELARLVERRVLHSDERNRVQWVEFTHDLLTEPALSSRTVRQSRQAELIAQRREEDVRRKLRRLRILSAMFAMMAVVMAAGAWRLNTALAEAKRQRGEAALALNKAEAQTQLAQQEKKRADDAAASEREAAEDAGVALVRAQQAEAEARSNLSYAQQTALSTAEQALARLKEQWVMPTFDSASVVRTNIANVEPLISQFGDLDAMRVVHKHLLALGALVHFERGEERACRSLAERSQRVVVSNIAPSPAVNESLAISQLALGSCMQLRGQFTESEPLLKNAVSVAGTLPAGSPGRVRLLVASSLARGWTARWRYLFDTAAQALTEAEAALPQPHVKGLEPGEAHFMQLQAIELRARLSDVPAVRLAQAQRGLDLAAKVPPELRRTIGWQAQTLEFKLDKAWTLRDMWRMAEADDLVQQVLVECDAVLGSDSAHLNRQLKRLEALRLRAEIQSTWARNEAADVLIAEVDDGVARILAAEPRHIMARYQQSVAAWLRANYAETKNGSGNKRALLSKARSLLDQLNKDAPDYGAVRRDMAMTHRDLGQLDAAESSKTGRTEAERKSLRESAHAHFLSALKWLSLLSRAQHLPLVADQAGVIELFTGDLLLEHQDPKGALEAFKRSLAWYRRVPVSAENEVERSGESLVVEMRIARALRYLDRWQEAAATDKQMLVLLGSLRAKHPGEFKLIDNEAWVHRMAAMDYLRGARLSDAVNSQVAAAGLLHQALKDDLLSKPAEESLNQVLKYAKDSIAPAVVKSGDGVLSKRLPDIWRFEPSRAYDLQERGRPSVPVMAGPWEHVDVSLKSLEALGVSKEADALISEGWTLTAARRMALSFYQNVTLVELDLQRDKAGPSTASFVVEPGRQLTRLNGDATVVHTLNSRQSLSLSTPMQAANYIRFFLLALEGKDYGRFRLIDQASDLIWLAEADQSIRSRTEGLIQALQVKGDPDGSWTAHGTVQYGTAVYHTKFVLSRNGYVAMMNDRPFAETLPLSTDVYEKSLRRRQDDFARIAIFEAGVSKAKESHDWHAAANAQQALVNWYLGRSVESKGGKIRAGEYLSLSWYRLLEGQPVAALKASDEGLLIEGTSLPLQTNRAHALLLLGRASDAMNVYRQHIGKPILPGSELKWEDVILDDLNRFDKYGLKDRRFEAVRHMMEAAKP